MHDPIKAAVYCRKAQSMQNAVSLRLRYLLLNVVPSVSHESRQMGLGFFTLLVDVGIPQHNLSPQSCDLGK